MLGKAKCKILKEIRQKIADENDIPYVTRECTYQGDCAGTCPRCESELRYLERELEARRRLGKTVALTALCAGVTLGTVGCSSSPGEYAGDITAPSNESVEDDDKGELSGDVQYVPDDEENEMQGELAPEYEEVGN